MQNEHRVLYRARRHPLVHGRGFVNHVGTVHTRSRATERVLFKAEGLVTPYLGSPSAEKGEQGHFNCCTSISHGEIFCSRKTTGILKDNLTKQVGFYFNREYVPTNYKV